MNVHEFLDFWVCFSLIVGRAVQRSVQLRSAYPLTPMHYLTLEGSDIDGERATAILASQGYSLHHGMGGRVLSNSGGQTTIGEGNPNAAGIESQPKHSVSPYGKKESGPESRESTLRSRVSPSPPPVFDPEIERLLVKWISWRIDR